MKLRALLVAPLLAIVGSCDSSGPTTITGLNGAVTFTYSGPLNGTFNASGAFPSSQGSIETTSWAAGELLVSGNNAVALAAVSPRNASSHDYFGIYVNRTTAGSATISSSCSFNCDDVFIIFGAANGNGTTFLQSCFLTSGTITITEITATRVKGTFSGTGECSDGGTPTSFTITNGTFDVALVSGST